MKSKHGVFCFLIQDARETKEIEMPERYANTFVLKVIIQALYFISINVLYCYIIYHYK